MNGLRLLPVILSCLLLAAHFLRSGLWPAVAACALLPLLLLARRPWVPLVMQVALFFGALEWIRTLMLVAAARMAAGQPWLRMAAILVAVTLLTAASTLVFLAAPLRRRYRLTTAGGPEDAPPGKGPA